MLTIVMANPAEVTMVSAVPLLSGGADCATRVENCGESATTVIPHITSTDKNPKGGSLNTLKAVEAFNCDGEVLFFPGTNNRINSPPVTESRDVVTTTYFQLMTGR